MKRRAWFAAGLAAGYVVGARAGRPAYKALVDRFESVASSQPVRRAGDRAKQVLEEHAPGVAEVAEGTASAIAGAASAAKHANDADADAGPESEGSAAS